MKTSKYIVYALTIVFTFWSQIESLTICNAIGDFCGQRDLSGKSISDAIYHCSAIGSIASLKSQCPNKTCVTSQDGRPDYCAGHEIQNNCICAHGNGDFCGQRTAPYLTGSCESGALYHCTGMGIAASLKSHCPDNVCITSDGGTDSCKGQQIQNCTCTYGNGDFCGQRTAPYLTGNCVGGALYHCSGMGLTARMKGYCANNVCVTSGNGGVDYCAGVI